MPLAIPPELKPITAYIRRSEELDADKSDPNNRVIAHYCRTFAMEKAMNLGATGSDSVNTFLMNLMQDLETSKASISMSRDQAKELCENHAVGIFLRADDEDRGSGDNYREIAREFYNSSTFFDILEQFGPLDEELNSKRTYSKWKATEIMKALKEGRTPTPGGYGGDDAPSPSDSTPTPTITPPSSGVQDMSLGGGSDSPSGFSLPPAPTGLPPTLPPSLPSVPGSFQMPQQPQYGQQQQQYHQPPQQQYHQPPQPPQYQQPPQQQYQPPQPPPSSMQPASHQPSPNYVPPPKSTNLQGNIADALELCAFAMAALKHNDTKLGRERLRDALNLLS